jgi:hypothetical protein
MAGGDREGGPGACKKVVELCRPCFGIAARRRRPGHAAAFQDDGPLADAIGLKSPAALTTLAETFRLFEDLFKLLTGHDYELGWPVLTLPDGSTCRWYFLRPRVRGHRRGAIPLQYDHDVSGIARALWYTMGSVESHALKRSVRACTSTLALGADCRCMSSTVS